jgi:hypothetical protein
MALSYIQRLLVDKTEGDESLDIVDRPLLASPGRDLRSHQ